jgi:hypothetical protein
MKKIYEIASKSEEEGTDPTDALTENFKKSKREKFI